MPGPSHPAGSSRAADAARRFFALYAQHDVTAMIALFEPASVVEYVPFHLVGPVEEVGPGSWGVLIDAFPDLWNRVRAVHETSDGRAAFVDVNIGGTQRKAAFGVESRGRSYDVRHLFVVEVGDEERITRMTSFWDNADWFRQLGKRDLD